MLLDEFLQGDCSDGIAIKLISEIEYLKCISGVKFKEYTFNRFNVYIDLSNNFVRLEDDLEPDDNLGVQKIDLSEFIEKLKGFAGLD